MSDYKVIIEEENTVGSSVYTNKKETQDLQWLPLPQKTTTERLLLSGMPDGALVYDTTLNSCYVWNGGAWIELSPGLL